MIAVVAIRSAADRGFFGGAQAADAQRARAPLLFGGRRLRGASGAVRHDDGTFLVEMFVELLTPRRHIPTQPLEGHHRVFDLLVAVVFEDAPQLGVVASLDTLIVPIHRLDLLF